ncbi:hypothetical protein DV517_09970 [Streptomyces sp. S816]|uniref:hypothetical protein n=1 Tax=Streptomyces sp. S816 TaxID=2283197 RepID=UPI00109D52ED|nr:hypothetical protein [Streptomyces sp. S816]TGZ16024.1 hypothetical protein DV517_09970 [Streptomyces sp. S816]
MKLLSLEKALATAIAATEKTEEAAATVLKARDTYDQHDLQPARATAWLESSDYIKVIARWTELFLVRLQQINPDVETAYIGHTDSITRVKERDEADKTFTESSVAASPKIVTNVVMLLSLCDLGRADPAVCVPPL